MYESTKYIFEWLDDTNIVATTLCLSSTSDADNGSILSNILEGLAADIANTARDRIRQSSDNLNRGEIPLNTTNELMNDALNSTTIGNLCLNALRNKVEDIVLEYIILSKDELRYLRESKVPSPGGADGQTC